ncbi:MAG TPA: MAE_28990/MAE_18760 family HEPN-like nuclease [Pseudobdellovibrionaceae bacterium]|nr:MAE_28990/MAE_18760 family HEPN-like nuclease [Pseudobdellovibrionaceae bacterium]
MKIRTKENFIDLIDKEIAWRKKELSFLKSNVKENSPNYKTHLRSAIVLLYAHWEGFVKNSCELYLSYVKTQKLNYNQLSENIIALSLKNNLRDFEQSNKSTIHCQVVDFLLNSLNQRANIPDNDTIKTGSNLTSSVLREILTSVGLDYKEYELKNNLIDSVLLKNRNSIAHGEFVELNELNYIELYLDILAIMDDIKNRLSNSVVLESFKRRTVPLTHNATCP